MPTTINNIQVISLAITMPLVGLWTADVSIDSSKPLTGSATIAIDELMASLVGTVARGAVNFGRWEGRIVGGAGKLSTVLPAKAYRGQQGELTAKLVASDILAAAGETLSPQSTNPALRTAFPHWVRSERPAVDCLEMLTSRLGLTWRALADGTVWLGTETWDAVSPKWTLMERRPRDDSYEAAVEAFLVTPGTTFDGRKVSRVQHLVEASKVRSTLWFAP